MRRPASVRTSRRSSNRRPSREQSVTLFAIVDSDKIPARCFGDPLCLSATGRRCAKAYEVLCETLSRNRQVGLATVAVDGAQRLAAILPIGNVLAVSPLRAEYAAALADGLRATG